jgi:diketogulonate reductase-like aldo/keto reductase
VKRSRSSLSKLKNKPSRQERMLEKNERMLEKLKRRSVKLYVKRVHRPFPSIAEAVQALIEKLVLNRQKLNASLVEKEVAT